MLINEVFAKDVQRPIEGVIKADDVSHLATEVDEYVLTNEVAKGLDQLLEAYTNYTNANGVWISGFFGSGKSHLLKMLAHLLGDVDGQEYSRDSVCQSFAEKAADDSFLTASLAKAQRIPAKCLLFNIGQKATLISKGRTDVLLGVFVKVFDESRGYYGNQGYIARFERDLDNRGQLLAFKDAYARISGREWLQGREEGILEEANVARAYAQITGQVDGAPTNILAKYRDEYEVSIDGFAEEVKAWLDKQEPHYRLNFLIDEVGQFIGTDTGLMLSLQTIAESLNTKCHGRAWVFVTSQEDMEKVLGDRTKSQSNDFSKIQARFATRVKLTSADVEEVIRKRLLTKNDRGSQALEAIYTNEHGNFKTLFDFVDGAKTYRNYVDMDHFVGTYPFVSYQFPLFQAAIESISDHNVFEGRNSSVGERSMLAVIQQVAKEIGQKEIGTLATFDQMFLGIRATLKSAAQRSIDVAERNLDDPLAVRLLMALFLVKYVEDFQATARNLTVLVYDQFGLNLPELSKRVQNSLALLEAQTYVRRNGDVYEYLTDDEKEIESAIKNVDVDSSEFSSRLNKILSADVIKLSKIRYSKNGQDFPFGYKLDDQAFGKQQELTLHFLTPEYPLNSEEILMQSAGKDELRVILGSDERIMADLRLLMKAEKYIKRELSSSTPANRQRILQVKATQNSERQKELIARIRHMVGNAALVVNAAKIPSTSQDAVARVTDGFQSLISSTYTQLKLLGGHTYTEQQVGELANPVSGLVDPSAFSALAAPGDEVFSFVLQRNRLDERVTVKAVIDRFQAKPYGWDIYSIEATIAWLIGSSKATLSVDSNTLKRDEVAAALRNTQKHAYTIVVLQKEYDQHKVNAFRDFCIEFFDDPSMPKSPTELAHVGAVKLRTRLGELKALVAAARYPFVNQLGGPITLLEQITGHKDEWYLTDFSGGNELLDEKSNVIDPIMGFISGGQHVIYDDAVALLTQNSTNLDYLPAGATDEIRQLLADSDAFRGNKMNKLKAALKNLKAAIADAVAAERAVASQAITSRWEVLHASAVFRDANPQAQHQAEQIIAETIRRVDTQPQIAVIKEIVNAFEATVYPATLDQLDAAKVVPDQLPARNTPPAPKKKTVFIKNIRVATGTAVLADTADVDAYVDALRVALMNEISNGKRIAL
ncbi:MAG: BREX system P-loop protein BrxC [Ancrocorticia sp.]|jgi:hypothetical protein|nr:BREX system P-loop protein BrxC [Ancrocorticia sp.]MCI2178171.1 BREX system P-loop protein BrxC [Ancrocorticia sp.]